jgi:hypothetical protein
MVKNAKRILSHVTTIYKLEWTEYLYKMYYKMINKRMIKKTTCLSSDTSYRIKYIPNKWNIIELYFS